MIKTIKFESLNLCQFRVVGVVHMNEDDNTSFQFEFNNKGFKDTIEGSFIITPDEIDSLVKYKRRCLADIGR